MADGGAGSPGVLDVDVAQRLRVRPATAQDDGHAPLLQHVQERVAAVDGDQQDAVDAVAGEVAGQPGALTLRVHRDEQHQ